MRLMRNLRDAVVFLVVLTAVLFLMQEFGMVDLEKGNVQVVDGDSLREAGVDIRLYGIDAPEYRQTCFDANRKEYPCGQKAAQTLRELVRGQNVTCSSLDTDRYHRAVSICRAGQLELNAEMVKQGWAVAYIQHSLNYVTTEATAKRAKRGLWAGTFEPPQDYRARNRKLRGDMGGVEQPD